MELLQNELSKLNETFINLPTYCGIEIMRMRGQFLRLESSILKANNYRLEGFISEDVQNLIDKCYVILMNLKYYK